MKFDTERELVTAFIKFDRDQTNTEYAVYTELNSSNGIADIVYAKPRNNSGFSQALKHVAPQWAYVLKALPYRKIFTTTRFIELTGVSKQTANSVINTFIEAGFCKKGSQPNTWIKSRQPKPYASQIVAIEAKLSNWKRALEQAYRYLEYASESWVLLDSARASGARKNIEQFKKLNIGFITLEKSGNKKILFRPQKRSPKSNYRHWHVQTSLFKLGL